MSRKWLVFIVLLLSTVAGHWSHFNLSPRGVHLWRQCNTLSVARNYHQEDMNILYPRVDHRKQTNGITGMSFPLYEWLLAQSYSAFGEHELNHRLLQWLINALGAMGHYLLLLKLFRHELGAAIGLFAYLWSPEIYYHSVNALPDILAMSSIIWSSYFFVLFRKSSAVNHLVLCMLLLTLGGLVKLQFSLFGFWFLSDRLINRRKDQALLMSLLGLLAAGLIANWYIHSIWLRFENNLQDYGLFLNPADNLGDALRILKMNLLSDLPEQLIGYGLIPLFVLGLFFVIKSWSSKSMLGPALLLLLFAFFHLQELKQMEFHAYYMMPYVLFASILIGFAVSKLRIKWMYYVLPLLLGIQLVHSLNKIQPRFSDENSGLPTEFLDSEMLSSLQMTLEGTDRALVGPDPTGCVYFYFLKCKGWNAFAMYQIEEKDHIEAAFDKELIQFMAIKDMDNARKEYYSKMFNQREEIGSFTVFKP